jgi:hypothetical protein
MDAPRFAATRLVRPALLFYILIVVISSMAMVKSAQASGTVASSTNNYAVGWSGGGGYVNAATPAAACGPSSQMWGPVLTQFSWGWICTYTYRSDVGLPQSYWGTTWTEDVRYISPVCPANSSGTPCTCTDPYVPDSAGTSCVSPPPPPPPPNCPAHAKGTPPSCVCDAGYEFDATRTSCIQEQYTLSLKTFSEMEPSDSATDSWANVIATVLDAQTQQPKAGATVSINVDVVANSGGHNHDDGRHVSPHTGTLDTTTGITGADGTFTFTFTAPEVSGTHTFTATCVQPTCTNNPATTQIDVKVDGLAPIPSSLFYRFISPNADTNHPDNHNLQPAASAQLASIAKAYYEATYLLKDGWLPNVMLNDASLKWGGILDCFETCLNTDPPSVPWGPAHGEHRRGSVVDIRARLPAVNDPNNPSADTLLYADKFIEKALKAGADPYPEGSHYHLRLFGIPE